MNGAFDLRMGESHIEVHKFRTGAILIATLLALVIQAWFPLHFARMALLDLPLGDAKKDARRTMSESKAKAKKARKDAAKASGKAADDVGDAAHKAGDKARQGAQ